MVMSSFKALPCTCNIDVSRYYLTNTSNPIQHIQTYAILVGKVSAHEHSTTFLHQIISSVNVLFGHCWVTSADLIHLVIPDPPQKPDQLVTVDHCLSLCNHYIRVYNTLNLFYWMTIYWCLVHNTGRLWAIYVNIEIHEMELN